MYNGSWFLFLTVFLLVTCYLKGRQCESVRAAQKTQVRKLTEDKPRVDRKLWFLKCQMRSHVYIKINEVCEHRHSQKVHGCVGVSHTYGA